MPDSDQQNPEAVEPDANPCQGGHETSLADLIDGALKWVKQYPGEGVLIAALVGFFLGRLSRR